MRLDEMAEDPVNESPLTPVGRPVCMIVRGKVKAEALNLGTRFARVRHAEQTAQVSWRGTGLKKTAMASCKGHIATFASCIKVR